MVVKGCMAATAWIDQFYWRGSAKKAPYLIHGSFGPQVASRQVLYQFSCFAALTYMPNTDGHTDHATHLYQ